MTKREAVVLASRALALYLICWALSDVTHLPQVVFSFRHHSSVLVTHDYWWNYYRIELTFYLVRIVALFVTAGWLIKPGEGIYRYFFPSEQAKTKPDAN